ncbi:MAG: hypothetical protein IID49_14445 [Proteobacteria bacterium]|nr:hypothetical protein [Pseudomonadota bacterium]
MELIADGLLIVTAMTAGLYCLVLSRRLRRLTDSGNSIGPQIEALDRALDETRAALAETRDGVSELRSSTRATIDRLARETERGGEMAELIESGVGEAKATMQRLYEAADRIEAIESRTAAANHGGDGDPDVSPDDPPDGPPGNPPDGPPGDPPDDHPDEISTESAVADAPVTEARTGAGDDPPVERRDENAGTAGEGEDGGPAAGLSDDLPAGKLVGPGGSEDAPEDAPKDAPKDAPEDAPVASGETAGERTGSVLKAERVMM